MSDDQFSPGSSPDPANDNFDVSTLAHDEVEPSLSPIGTPLPSEWPEPPDDATMPDEATIILPDGAQYPDDVFGAPPAGEAPVTLPAIEPESLAPPASDNGDMFSIDDLMDKPAAIAGDDMFSVDELIGEDENDSPAEDDDADPPAALAPPQPAETPDLLGPYGITQSQTAMPASDFAFTEPTAAEPRFDVAPQPAAAPDLDVPAPPAVVNPYATATAPAQPEPAPTPEFEPEPEPYPREPAAVDPAMPTGMGFEPPVAADVETPGARPIVNPYATMSDEPMAIDAVPPPSATAPTQPEPEPTPEFEPEPEPSPLEPEPDASMPPTYGATSYADPETYTTPLPPTDRTVSVAPPGMDVTPPAGPIVAGSKRTPGKPSRSRKTAKQKTAKQTAAQQTAANQPSVAELANAVEAPSVAEPANAVEALTVVEPTEATKTPKPAKAPKAPKTPKPAKAAKIPKPAKPPKPPKAAKPPKAPKQGKSLTDALLGKVEPGQRHKIFGIPVGKPAPPNAP